jgi:TolB-like protein/Flp pilus assembly protein TadD
MQAQATSAVVCPECGTRLEGGFSRNLGRCMICLLRVGFDGAEEPDETLFAPVTDRFGNYRIERHDDGTLWELGRGAMGVTYRAVDTSLQRPVALKLIDPERVKRGAEARERFMREARTAASLRHPNVATVYHFGIREENGQCFCAIELVEGETLEMRVRRTGPLDALTTIDIALQVSSALATAEKQGLVHRDLKPANLMFVSAALDASDSSPGKSERVDTVVKVIDFGVAKALVEKPDAMGLTHGGFVGTPAFASPEQFTDAAVGVRSDIYSLGVTLWYLLTGHRPFEGATIEQIRASQRSRALPIEQLKAARVPSRLISLLMSMLALEPAARPDIRALTSQLQDCRAQILDRWKTARRLALVAGLIGIAAAAFALFPRWHNQAVSQSGAHANIPPKSIAVLPFRNLSEDKENAFFADGIQDDLLTSLARIKDLKVVSRSSVASYRDLSGHKLRAIAQELGVGTVLEGSVRRTANRVLVSVQLTDATTERQIWSDRYNRTLQDAMALQGELAAEIATALAAKLSPEEKAQVESKLTNNPDAYVVYLRGREFQMRPEVSRDNFVAAEQCYRHAVALDSRFALANARLAEILEGRYGWFDHQPALLAEARSYAEEALRLDPHCGQAHMEMARILAFSVKSNERDEAMKQEVDSALRLVPNDGYLVMIAALLQTEMDWLEEAEATFQRAIEINPREPKVFYNYAGLQLKKRDVAKARWASDRSLELAPESVYFRLFRAIAEFEWTGEVARTKKFLAEIPAGKDPDGRVTAAYCTVALYERNFPEALRLLAACPFERLPWFDGGFGPMVPKGFLEGWIHFYAGNKERAYAALDSVRWILEAEAKENPGDQQAHLHVAFAYAVMGWKDAALAEIARAKEKPDGFMMAALYAHAGDRDAALRLLEQVPAERENNYYDLRLGPHWDPLRSDARFEKMLASSAPKTAAVPEKSIAVLPFRNLSEDKDNAFFADGIQDDLVTSLARIKDLKVVSRGSVASYRDLSGRRLRAIAQELSVGAVLEGSVRRTANRVLVNVQLTDATTERQIWSDRYDRTLKDSIALQGELAAEIATALAAKISPEEKAQVEAKLTNNPDAYVVYLRGREFQMRPEVSRDNFIAAEQCYRHAVALDPRFALAHARLAEILEGRDGNFDHQPALVAEARSHAEEALRLDPHCGQAHMVMAYILARSAKSIERDKAIREEVASALRLVPNDGYLVMLAALFQTDMDWLAEAEATFQRAIEINPREPKVFYNYAYMLTTKGDVAKARWASDRSLELAPESVFFRLFRAIQEFRWTGEVARTKKFLAEIPAGKDPDGRVTAAHCTAAVYERNFPEALRLLAACPSGRLPFLYGGFGHMVPKGFVEGMIHFYAGNKERAYTALDSARWILEMEAKENPGDEEAHQYVAMAYAAMGWKDAALAENAGDTDGLSKAWLFAHAGERDAALRQLEQLPAKEREYWYYELRLHPHWDPLRSDARFEKMLASSKSKTAR